MYECDCSEEYGPCEDHSEVLAQREGASARTADELAFVFLDDVLAIVQSSDDVTKMQVRADDYRRLRNDVAYWSEDEHWTDNHGVRWLDVDRDVNAPDRLMDALYHAASVLSDIDLMSWWEDGYMIARITGGPLDQ